MIFQPATVQGAFVIETEQFHDERGFFARTFCHKEFQNHGLSPKIVQCSLSFNKRKGTLRGMHFQIAPHEETKLVRCTMGELFDTIIDLRPDSPTYMQNFSVILSAENRKMLYIPEGCAHGFQTLTDNTEIFYQMSQFYAPDYARGVRWNDPVFAIEWPDVEERVINDRDRNYPDYQGR